MLFTDANQLKAYTSEYRMWQGIPGIERTKKGRIFISFYSGARSEDLGNYAILVKSDDGGQNFGEPIAVAYYNENTRVFDPALWIDPLGRLWFSWSVYPGNRVEFAICKNPDADELVWEEPRTLGYDIMLNKPTVLQNGDWLFHCSVWEPTLNRPDLWAPVEGVPTGAHVFLSRDEGKTFSLYSTVRHEHRSFDEHRILEKRDGTLAMYLRTTYGVGVCYSTDGGATWSQVVDSGLKGPCSRIFIGRLKSGRVLLINHHNFTGRNNLTAFLSEDDGATFPYSLLLDARDQVSYPDAVEGEDGYIYVTYDHERGALYNVKKDFENHAREILMAKFTEDDLLAGALVSPNSQLRLTVSRLGFRKTPADYFEKRKFQS